VTREWKPGDVAVIGGDVRALAVTFRSGGCHGTHPREVHWHREDGDWNVLTGPRAPIDVSPLVVIAPEDREQVNALAEALCRHRFSDDAADTAVQAALRALANPQPPKPDEPTGWLAAVLDSDGNRWTITGGPNNGRKWYSPDLNIYCEWSDIAAVKVLSEGVTP
jgi:hypothetical protein